MIGHAPSSRVVRITSLDDGKPRKILIHDTRDLGVVLPHLSYDQAQLVVFAGRRGYGKTTGIKAYFSTREPRGLIIDHYGDYPQVKLSPSLESALEDLASGEPCRRRIFPGVSGNDMHAWADDFFMQCYDRLRNCLVVLNEITLLSKPVASMPLTIFVTQGRRRGLRIATDAQRLNQVPYVVQSECTELAICRVSRPRDRKALAGWADEDIAQLSRRLAIGECLAVEP